MATMRFVLNIVLIFTIVQLAKSAKCPEAVGHYVQLGCTPVYLEANKTCPIRFDCSFVFNDQRDHINYCYHKSKAYKDGEKLAEKDIDASCNKDCVCRTSEAPKFMCATKFCWDWVNYDYEHALGLCLEPPDYCDREQTPNATECRYSKTTYQEGDIIETDDCLSCVCDKGYNGTRESLQCNRTPCWDNWNFHTVAKKGCAAIYSYDFDCCPAGWRCTDSGPYSIVHTNQTIRSEDPNMKCKFGEELLDVGDEVDGLTGGRKFMCSCTIPPLVTCIINTLLD